MFYNKLTRAWLFCLGTSVRPLVILSPPTLTFSKWPSPVFASVPSLERALLASPVPAQFFILDLTHGHRIETAAARVFLRCVRELKLKDSMLVVCGVRSSSGLHSDFVRAEVPLVFDSPDAASLTGSAVAAFETRAVCLAWCQQEHENRLRAAKKPESDSCCVA
jgi:hypothetical protein